MVDTSPADPRPEPTQPDTRLRYRLLTGPDDRSFCERVSAALDQGYQLHGGPVIGYDGARVLVAQAVVLPAPAAVQAVPV